MYKSTQGRGRVIEIRKKADIFYGQSLKFAILSPRLQILSNKRAGNKYKFKTSEVFLVAKKQVH